MKKHHILVVDDVDYNYQIVQLILGQDYELTCASRGDEALRKLREGLRPDLILLDVVMPGMNGFEVCERIKSDYRIRDIPVIFTTGLGEVKDEQKGFDVGAADYIVKPYSPAIMRARIKTQLALLDQHRELQRLVEERTREIEDTQIVVIERLGKAAEYKDNQTGKHVIRMSWYAKILAKAAGMCEKDAETLRLAAPMHDVGKIKIPDRILKSSEKLSEEDMETMKQHARFGAEIIGDHHSDLLMMAKEVALRHHERWDGKGYPDGLKGEDIPLTARVVMVADVFDALTSSRPYKEPWTIENAVKYIEDNAGRAFDPGVANLVRENLPGFKEIYNQFKDEPDLLDQPKDSQLDESLFALRR